MDIGWKIVLSDRKETERSKKETEDTNKLSIMGQMHASQITRNKTYIAKNKITDI